MQYRDSLWDNSEPDYAPCITYSKGIYPRWKAPKKYIDAGYQFKGIKLDGRKGDGNDLARAEKCREYTRDMVRWWNGEEANRIDTDTWIYLIARYKDDDFSPMNTNVKANTRLGYLQQLKIVEDVWGDVNVASCDFESLMTVKLAMENKGRSRDYIKRHFDTMKRVAKYGKVLRHQGAIQALMSIEGVKVGGSPSRNVNPTREQVMQVVAEADARGMAAFACGLLIQYEYALRAVDVRGHWLPADQAEGGIQWKGRRWQDGLTWDMFDGQITQFSKVISKTAKSLPEPYTFSLDQNPEIRDRLMKLPNAGRAGPVLVNTTTGMPYDQMTWTRTWARLRDAIGLPKELKCMDLRAGAISEAEAAGATMVQLRDAGQHKNQGTTQRYIRNRSNNAQKVVELRKAAK